MNRYLKKPFNSPILTPCEGGEYYHLHFTEEENRVPKRLNDLSKVLELIGESHRPV